MSTDANDIIYDAINFDGLGRRANYRTVAYRVDMLHVFGGKDAAATLYEIIYRWQFEVRRPAVLREIERRKKAGMNPLTPEEAEEMMWVYMSYNDFVRETGGAIAYNTVIRTLDYLVNDIKALEQQENHDPKYPDFEYRINKAAVHPLLEALPAEPSFTPKIPKKRPKSTQLGTAENQSTQLGTSTQRSTQNENTSTQLGRGYTQNGREVYPNGGTSHTTHILPTHTSPQENVLRDAAHADITDTPVIHPLYPFLSFDDLHHPTVMTITFEDDERAEITNDGYALTGQDVVAELEAKGITVQVRTEHRRRVATIDALQPHTEVSHVDGLSRQSAGRRDRDSDYSSTHGSSLHALGEMGGQTTPETPGTTTQVQAQETPVSDSYSHATPDPLPSVSFLEASVMLEAGSQENVGAADENDTHSHDDGVEYVPEWAQGATNGSSAISSLCSDSPGTHPCGEVGTEETKNADGVGSEISSGVDANNPAMQQPDVRNRQPGPASRSAGERRTGERGAGPDTGDDRPVVPNGAAGNRVARGRGGKGTGVEPPALSPINTTLAMPDECAAWPNVETALLIAEHLRKRAFAPKQREKQAKKMQRVFADKPDLTREEWHNAYESRNDAWWNEHNGPLTVDDIYANDRLQKEIDRLAAGHPSRNAQPKPRAAPPMPAKPVSSPMVSPAPYVVDEERNKRNIARLMAGAQQAKQLGNVKAVIPMPVMD